MLTADRLRELLGYDPATGKFIWRVNLRGRWARKGAIAGTLRADGRRQICLDQIIYLTGPLAFLWMTGRRPTKLIDHINLDRDDDRWSNLREANHSQNGANSRDRPSGTPFKGVTWDRERQKYQGRIKINYRNLFLGRFDTPQAAHAAYVAAAKQQFGEFAREA